VNREKMEDYRQTLLDIDSRVRANERAVTGDALRPSGTEAEGSTVSAPGDTGDRSVDQSQQDVALGLFETERLIRGQIAEALRRIDDGTFGRCTECGQEIDWERLQALPYTPYCLDCARRLEGSPGGLIIGDQ
jgi:RNA polymerase-binding transcription factor DksA